MPAALRAPGWRGGLPRGRGGATPQPRGGTEGSRAGPRTTGRDRGLPGRDRGLPGLRAEPRAPGAPGRDRGRPGLRAGPRAPGTPSGTEGSGGSGARQSRRRRVPGGPRFPPQSWAGVSPWSWLKPAYSSPLPWGLHGRRFMTPSWRPPLLSTAYRSKPDDLSRRAALGPPRPEARVLRACVVRVSSLRADLRVRMRQPASTARQVRATVGNRCRRNAEAFRKGRVRRRCPGR